MNFSGRYPTENSGALIRVEGAIETSARAANNVLIELKNFNSDQLFKISQLLLDFYVQSIPTRGHRNESINDMSDKRNNPGNFLYFLNRESEKDAELKRFLERNKGKDPCCYSRYAQKFSRPGYCRPKPHGLNIFRDLEPSF